MGKRLSAPVRVLQWLGEPGNSVLVAKWLVAFLILVRLVAVFRFQHDIDESQNLHIVYGWIEGELPYRDRFDNHAPLFAWMFAPLAWVIGENPNIVIFARLALFPFGLGGLYFIFRIAQKLADRDVAWWTVALCLALADWSLKSVEFRPDVIWLLFWFGALWLLVRRLDGIKWWDVAAIGGLLGVALLASIKTTLLVPSLGLACVMAVCFCPALQKQLSFPKALGLALIAFCGFLIPPLIGFGALIANGVEPAQIQFCLFEVNQSTFEPLRWAAAGGLLVVMGVAAVAIFRGGDFRAAITGILFVSASTFLILLLAMAPEVRKQTLLVAYPLLILLGLTFVRKFDRIGRIWRPIVVAAWAAAFVHFVVESSLWHDGMGAQRQLLTQVLQLTDGDEYLFDGRGETIFAERPVYLAFVAVTTDAVEDGRLDSPDPNGLVSAPTSVAIGSLDGLPKAFRRYLDAHYLLASDGGLRVSGMILKPTWKDGKWTQDVSIALPGSYVIVKNNAVVDHVEIILPGPHTFDFGADRTRGFLIWEEAWTDGFRPQNDG